ncbi:zinc finger protein RFP [Pogona vitticeps]
MAAGGDPLRDLCEEATCAICLDYFKDPVTIQCGHNFCQACLARCWGKSEQEAPCPQCRVAVQPRSLIPNRPLANFVEILTRKLSLQGVKGVPAAAEERKRGSCEKHQEPLKLFCQDDQALICVVCDRAKEHRDHQVVPLEEAAQEYQDLICRWLKNLRSERESILASKFATEKEYQDLLMKADAERGKAVAEFRQLHQFLEEHEKLLLAQVKELEKVIVRRRDEHLTKLTKKLSSLGDLIQNMEEKRQQSAEELLLDIRGTLQGIELRGKFENPGGLPPELTEMISEVSNLKTFLANVMKQFKELNVELEGFHKKIENVMGNMGELQMEETDNWTPSKVQRIKPGGLSSGAQLQKANVTLDPDTAFPRLILSADCKSVRWGKKYQDLPKNPERFHLCPFVLGREGFSAGRHFWEVLVGSEEEWAVGVAKKSVKRKGPLNISSEEGIWAVGKSEGKYKAYYPPRYTPLSLKGDLKRIRVCLDYDGACVSFDDADTGATFCKFSEASFSGEILHPFFRVFLDGYLRISPSGSQADFTSLV